jgi:hypothetical protein
MMLANIQEGASVEHDEAPRSPVTRRCVPLGGKLPLAGLSPAALFDLII